MSGKLIPSLVLLCCLAAAVLAQIEPATGPAFCLQPPVQASGPCAAGTSARMYYYDHRSRDCEKIWYTGCGGTQNLFRSERECEAKCERFFDYDDDDDDWSK